MSRTTTLVVAAATVAVLAGCGGNDAAIVGAPVAGDVADITVVSDDSRATAEAVCVADIPDDLSHCAGHPEHVAEVELDSVRKGAVVLPADIASGGYRIRLNGEPLVGSDGVLEDQYQVFRVPLDVVREPGPTTLTVEALRTADHPRAVWQFLLSDPPGPPA